MDKKSIISKLQQQAIKYDEDWFDVEEFEQYKQDGNTLRDYIEDTLYNYLIIEAYEKFDVEDFTENEYLQIVESVHDVLQSIYDEF